MNPIRRDLLRHPPPPTDRCAVCERGNGLHFPGCPNTAPKASEKVKAARAPYQLVVTLDQHPGTPHGRARVFSLHLDGPAEIALEQFAEIARRAFDAAARVASEQLGARLVPGCPTCRGSGIVDGSKGTTVERCPTCGGAG